jgi:site-specific recombinase XerD
MSAGERKKDRITVLSEAAYGILQQYVQQERPDTWYFRYNTPAGI